MVTNKTTLHDIHNRTKVCVNIYSYYVYVHIHNHTYETSVSVMFSLEMQREGWVVGHENEGNRQLCED